MIKSVSSIVAVLVAFHVTLEVSQAQDPPDHTWHQFDASWFEANKWDQGTVPGNTSIVEIQEHIVTIGSPGAEALELRINPVYGFGAEMDISGDHFGTLATQKGFIGYSSSASGVAAVKVDGSGASWANAGDLIVGFQKWNGTNTLDVKNSASVSSARGILGDYPTPQSGFPVRGTATIDGTLSKWNMTGEIRVGNFGVGTLNITNQGKVTNSLAFVGVWGSSTGTVNVSGYSIWTSSSDLIVGYQSTATNRLNISNGGVALSNRGFIGDYGPAAGTPSAIGEVTVTDLSTTWDSGSELRVGNAGNGTLKILNQGTVLSAIGRVGVLAGSSGTVNVSGLGSHWTMTGDLIVGGAGNGLLSIGGGFVIAPTGVTIGTDGGVQGYGMINTNNVVNNGDVHPNNPFAPLTINGSYTQTSTGALNPDLDGDGIGKLAVNGSIALAGALNVTNLDFGWEPEIGQSFDLLDWVGGASGISGTFASITLPAIHGAKMWNKTQLYTTGVISVAKPGDFSDDGFVNAGDFIAWRKSGGGSAEYNTWRANFGSGGSGSGATALAASMSRAVPEPSSSALWIGATTLLTCGRRLRRQHITG